MALGFSRLLHPHSEQLMKLFQELAARRLLLCASVWLLLLFGVRLPEVRLLHLELVLLILCQNSLQTRATICRVATCGTSLATSRGVASLASLAIITPFQHRSDDAHRTWNRTTRIGYYSGAMLLRFWYGFRSCHVQPAATLNTLWSVRVTKVSFQIFQGWRFLKVTQPDS